MKKKLFIIILLNLSLSFAQHDESYLKTIKAQLNLLSETNTGLSENVKTEISINNISLANFLLAISEIQKVNINVAPELNQINITNNFSNVTVKDLLIFLCKEYQLTIDFTGNILSIKTIPKKDTTLEKRNIPIDYNPSSNTISMDLREDKLFDAFKKIMDETGKNLVFAPGLENKLLTAYILQSPFDDAMQSLAFTNNLNVEQSENSFFVFKNKTLPTGEFEHQDYFDQNKKQHYNFYFKVKNPNKQLLEVDFSNTPVANIINDIGKELNIDLFTATPLTEAGVATFKAKNISFEDLLTKIFEGQNVDQTNYSNIDNGQQMQTNTPLTKKRFTYKKEGDVYYFGTENQLSVREIAIVHLQHRSVELLTNPNTSYSNNRNTFNNFNAQSINQNGFSTNQFDNLNNRNRSQINTNSNQNFSTYSNKAEALISILPDEVKQNLDIKVDYELNSFYVHGASSNIKRFKKFINKIDKPVPVILIEVMFIEVRNNSTLETGISWGLGDQPQETKGALFPETDLTLGANTINKIIGGFDGFGSFNLGKVVPNFFTTIKAMEENGNLKIRSTPKLSTLNGHRANFSNGQTSYYTVTQRNIYGTDNPQTSEITNYYPIDAQLGLTIKPLVSGDGQVTLDIFVVQSSFGERVTKDAPPDISSREFSSIIRVRDQDIVILGGLEEDSRNNFGSGVPFLSKIPLIKWLFSNRKREAKKAKLTVLIKPTIIY